MKKIKKEQLELLSYQDVAKLILEDKKKGETTLNLFTEICRQLGLSDEVLQDKIGDFYTALTIDQRFIILKDGKWDLKSNHSINIIIEDDDDAEEVEDNFEETDETDETEDIDVQPDDDFEENELEDLVVVDEEDLNEN